MELTLNGRQVVAEPREGQSLLELLRDDLGLRSVKDGCAPEGSCGACTVIVDGRAVVSCAQQATRAAGKHVVTQEGLPQETPALGRVFAAAGASQCGFCSPGIVMKAEALLAKNPEPSREEIAHALLGQPLPLHGLREDRRRDRAGRRGARGGAAPELNGGRSARARRATGAPSWRSATSRSSTTWSCRGCSTARCASPTTRAARCCGSTRRGRWRTRASSPS